MLRRCVLGTLLFIWLLQPTLVFATQTHGGPEGLFVHQFAHLFFIFSMGLLIYWLRKRQLVSSEGWRYIQYAALFFIVWNLDAVFSHWLLEQSGLVAVENLDDMQMQITTPQGFDWLADIYYLSKLDHLLSVPAMVFLLIGLRRLYKSSLPMKEFQEPAP
jgi:hypothetical protein